MPRFLDGSETPRAYLERCLETIAAREPEVMAFAHLHEEGARTPGGSSSGSGAVIGARMLPAAIGTQVLGSVIRPASFNANWALKPTQGALNGGERQGFSQSTVGVHAGSAEDMEAVAEPLAEAAFERAVAALAQQGVDGFIGLPPCGPAPLPGDTGGSTNRILRTPGNPIMNTASSRLGWPVVTMPRMAVEGMPLGIAITGQPHQDERTVAIARWIAEAVPPIMVSPPREELHERSACR